MQNDVILRVSNSKIVIEILLWSYSLDFIKYLIRLRVTNLKVELLFFYFRVTTSKLENEKLLTQRRKIKNYTSSYQLEVQKSKVSLRVTKSKIKLFFFYFLVTNLKSKNKKLHFELLTRSGKIKSYTSSY